VSCGSRFQFDRRPHQSALPLFHSLCCAPREHCVDFGGKCCNHASTMLAQETGAALDGPRCPLLYQIRASVLLKDAGLLRPGTASHVAETSGGASGPGGAVPQSTSVDPGGSGDDLGVHGDSIGRHVTFDDVPDAYFETLRAKGFDVLYLLGACGCCLRASPATERSRWTRPRESSSLTAFMAFAVRSMSLIDDSSVAVLLAAPASINLCAVPRRCSCPCPVSNPSREYVVSR
jgi:hypothetical protein